MAHLTDMHLIDIFMVKFKDSHFSGLQHFKMKRHSSSEKYKSQKQNKDISNGQH